MGITLEANQIKEKRKIGDLNGIPVIELKTKGGFLMLASMAKGVIKYLATGPHIAICKYIAEQAEPNIQWELSKSESDEYLDPRSFASVIPYYTELTKKANDSLK